MGPATSHEQIGEQIGDDDGLHIHPNPTIVANNIVSVPFLAIPFSLRFFVPLLLPKKYSDSPERDERYNEMFLILLPKKFFPGQSIKMYKCTLYTIL